MGTHLQQPAAQRTKSQQRVPSPAFPLSSPHHESLTKFKPANSGAAAVAQDTFLSPNPFASSSSDEDDSGSSSGQDEFHLERYSQEANRMAQSSRPSRKQSRRRKQQEPSPRSVDKKARPGLNIVTTFSSQAKRSNTDGLLVEHVQSQRPRLGPRYATSIKSAKAEHMNHAVSETFPEPGTLSKSSASVAELSKRAIARQAVLKLQESQAARRKAAENTQTREARQIDEQRVPSADDGHLQQPASAASAYSPGARSIVIGMSIPEDEIDAHRSANRASNLHSAATPGTPAIVVTPADETESWKPSFFTNPRPPSSIWSSNARTGLQIQRNTPPVHKVPVGAPRLTDPGQFTAGASIIRTEQKTPESFVDDSDIEDERDLQSLENGARHSTDSNEPIVPSAVENRRHKSQGWWNLMLSPMLSRKGTIVENPSDRSPEPPPVPSIPADIGFSKAEVVSCLISDSPETPRRAGLASARASIWSRWTTWERERDGNFRSDPADATGLEAQQPRGMVDSSGQIPPLPTADLSKGLAGEYYHACAVELLTGAPYFECENHSCAEKWPQLHSIFDREAHVKPEVGTEAKRALSDSEGGESGGFRTNTPGQNATNGAIELLKHELVSNRGVSVRSEPDQMSPNVRQADTATVMRARAVEAPGFQRLPTEAQGDTRGLQSEPNSSQPVRSLPDGDERHYEPQYPNIASVASPHLQPPILSPGPLSPGMQRAMISDGAVPMTQIDHHQSPSRLLGQSSAAPEQQALAPTQPPSVTIHNHAFWTDNPSFENTAAVEEARREAMERLESTQAVHEAQDSPTLAVKEAPPTTDPQNTEAKEEKKGLWSRILKKLVPKKKSKNTTETTEKKKKKRRWTLIIAVILFFIVLACVLLATLLTRSGDGTPVQSQWLNLTGYPPMPTGISTIARPDVVKQQSKCVAPNTMWSCALPKENQFEVTPNSPDQPNFRFQITFRNGTVPANMTIPVHQVTRRSATQLDRRADDPFTNDLFTPSPTPPSRADQIFMGNTTDNITRPFEGEDTPFFITFVPVFPIDPSSLNTTASASPIATLGKRQSSNSTDDVIPAPDILADGSAAPANLLPTDPDPTSQPIKLYNRGQSDEHYGFYMYYDKAVFLESTAPFNASGFANNGGILPDDENGGSTRDQSSIRCTFSQTRFLVRMWTKPAFGATLLPRIADNSTTKAETSNSATDFSRPGSFPYPSTISIDRHGGNINKKAAYCYGVDQFQQIQSNFKTIVPEFRGVEGTIINPAPALVNGTGGNAIGFDQNAGGIDGGTGGCECVWQNWN